MQPHRLYYYVTKATGSTYIVYADSKIEAFAKLKQYVNYEEIDINNIVSSGKLTVVVKK